MLIGRVYACTIRQTHYRYKTYSRSEVVKIQLKIANALPLFSITKYPLGELRFWHFQAGDQRNTKRRRREVSPGGITPKSCNSFKINILRVFYFSGVLERVLARVKNYPFYNLPKELILN